MVSSCAGEDAYAGRKCSGRVHMARVPVPRVLLSSSLMPLPCDFHGSHTRARGEQFRIFTLANEYEHMENINHVLEC